MKVGVIGCGAIAALHLPHILKRTSPRFVSVADADPNKAGETARRFGLSQVYAGAETLLDEQNPAAVHILTPPATHGALAIQAMESGAHVLVEKPMALGTGEADLMIAAARTNRTRLCVNHNVLFDPLIRRLGRMAHRGDLGRVVHLEIQMSDTRRAALLRDRPDARGNWLLRLPGGPLFDLIPHPLSLLLAFIPHPHKIWAVAKHNGVVPGNLPDELNVLVDGGRTTASLSVSLAVKPDGLTVRVLGTERSASVQLSNMALDVRRTRKVPKALVRGVDNLEQAGRLLVGTFSNALKIAVGKSGPPGDVGPVINRFYASIENGTEPPVTGEDGKRVVAVAEEIRRQTGFLEAKEPVAP